MTHRLTLGLSLLLAITSRAASDCRCISAIPAPAWSNTSSGVTAISGNGMTVIGAQFVWNPSGWYQPSANASLTSSDRLGSSIAGFTIRNGGGVLAAVVLTQDASGNLQTLTLPPPSGFGYGYFGYGAKGISQDGRVVAGFCPVNDAQRAIRWSVNRLQGGGTSLEVLNLGTLEGGNYSSASAVSGDGSTIIGFGNTASSANMQAFWWKAETGMNRLGLPLGCSSSEPTAVNQDGTVIVGSLWNGSRYKPFRWDSLTGTNDIGLPSGFEEGWATAVSGDGTVVVGYCQTSFGPTIQRAFIWTSETGTMLLSDFLQAKGFDLTGWTLLRAHAISVDGSVVAGDGVNSGGDRSFVIRDLRTRSCPSDLDGDGEVNSADLSLLLLDFGTADGCSPDLDESGEVDAADLSLQLLDFGFCP